MRIDIVSDVICPWCFIGKRRLEKALALRPELATEVTWRPFQLNPDMPASGMERQAYLTMKFGSAAQADRLYRNVAAAGATVDIPFDFARIRRTPNTRKAHALIRQALAEGVADATVERLFRAYFLEGYDIGERTTLLGVAGEIGLEQSATERALDDPAIEERVVAEDRNARRLGVNAVPCFIFDGQYAVSGAQEPEFFLPIFDLVRNGAEATT
jgi:predicted DsbA family dithiol-disulfide isomerase